MGENAAMADLMRGSMEGINNFQEFVPPLLINKSRVRSRMKVAFFKCLSCKEIGFFFNPADPRGIT